MKRRTPLTRRPAPAPKRRHPKSLPSPLLYDRAQTASLLGGISTATVKRLEQKGVLQPVRLDPHAGDRTPVFYRASDVLALAHGGE
jgi:hypothetical protein